MRHQTPETLRASQSERDTSVPCCLYLSEDSNALAYISQCGRWGGEGGKGGEGGAATKHYSSLSFREELLVVGGKENMWAVRAVGMEACGRV